MPSDDLYMENISLRKDSMTVSKLAARWVTPGSRSSDRVDSSMPRVARMSWPSGLTTVSLRP